MEVEKITVVGAGLMGHGIAQMASQVGGYHVSLLDVDQGFLDRGMKWIKQSLNKFVEKGVVTRERADETLERIHPTLNVEEAYKDTDLVIEAVPEKVEIKRGVFEKADELTSPETIIATNTSSISITLLASFTGKPERVVGMHFFNPPQLMKLVEIVKGKQTSDQTVQTVKTVAEKIGKETVIVKKDSPGFIVNRILIPALNEALYLLWEGVAEPEDVDKAIKLGLNWPMGPFKLLDYIGLDTALSVINVFFEEFKDSKYRPCPLLTQMVRAGLLGRKTGKGIYDWKKK